MTLRSVIADDQASVREGLVLLLGGLPDIDVADSAADGEQALALAAEHKPDALLLDLHMPGLDGIAVTRVLTAEHPEVAIVVLTTYADDESVLEALRAGARSYLTKDADRSDIARALHAAAGGLSVAGPEGAGHAAGRDAGAVPARAGAAGRGAGRPDQTRSEDPRPGRPWADQPRDRGPAVLEQPHSEDPHQRIFAKTGSRDRAAAIGYAHQHGSD